jgi:hypothetical protein
MSEHHQWHSAEYVEDWIDHDMTRDDERRPLLHRVAALLPATQNPPLRVLDVGGGYGAFSAEVLGQRPDAHVVLHDYSSARDAGFTEADCVWKDLDQGLLWALRPNRHPDNGVGTGSEKAQPGPPAGLARWFIRRSSRVLIPGRAGSQVVAPGVAGLEAEHLPGAVDGQQGAELADLARQPDIGEDLGE